MNNIELINDDCTGCYLCSQCCPKECITFTENKEGFFYPEVDQEKCIDCGICLKNCKEKNESKNIVSPLLYDAALLNDDMIRNSASGGISAALMTKFLDRGNHISGAILDKEFNCLHIVTDRFEDLKKIQGSKYVQSSMKNVYNEIERISNSSLLFIGTPCQVAAVKQFVKMKKLSIKLYTVDILCHGVPSQRFFDKFMDELKQKYQKRIVDFRFRIKRKRFNRMTSSIDFEDGSSKVNDQIHCDYLKMYYSAAVYRKSCYKCGFAHFPRIGDLTIGDSFYSDKNDLKKEFDYNKGVSIVSVNSDKGKELLELLDNCKFLDEDKSILKYNENFYKSTPIKKRNPNIFKTNKSLHELNLEYNPLTLFNKIAYYANPKIIKCIKKILGRT